MPAVNRTSTFNESFYQFNGHTAVQRLRKVARNRQVSQIASMYATASNYTMRAWDSGTNGWVMWGPFPSPLTTPTASQTRPNFTGVLSLIHIASGP